MHISIAKSMSQFFYNTNSNLGAKSYFILIDHKAVIIYGEGKKGSYCQVKNTPQSVEKHLKKKKKSSLVSEIVNEKFVVFFKNFI